jgi:hypothetical protein
MGGELLLLRSRISAPWTELRAVRVAAAFVAAYFVRQDRRRFLVSNTVDAAVP